jgi:hypothetical protein
MRLEPAINEAKLQRRVLESRCDYVRACAAKTSGIEAEELTSQLVALDASMRSIRVPASPKFWSDDCTPEMMGSLLAEQDGRMAIISAEGTIFDLMAGRYSKGQPNIGVYLAGHAGDPYMVDRRGRPSEYVPQAAISIGITVQHEVLRNLAERPQFRGCGLLARFLYSVPKSRLGRRNIEPTTMPTQIRERYKRNIQMLLMAPFGTDENGQRTANVLTLDASAYALFKRFNEVLEPMLAPYAELAEISDWAGKLCGAIARLAGMLHAASAIDSGRTPWEHPIDGDTMHRTLQLTDYLIAHARAAFAEMNVDPLVEQAHYILGWLEKRENPVFTQRELFEGIKGDLRFKRVETLREPLGLLLELGWLRPRKQEHTGRGRKPSAIFELNPHVQRNQH